mgnify:CR=1 FL=1|tara:strand:- start:51 stop:290 length:240 start_codon:yes stop_codon:yes gene_type:complete
MTLENKVVAGVVSAALTSAAAVLILSAAACSPLASGGSGSRWTPIEAPRGDLECWQTRLNGGAMWHVECWPKVGAEPTP